jgi:hypothetical protein
MKPIYNEEFNLSTTYRTQTINNSVTKEMFLWQLRKEVIKNSFELNIREIKKSIFNYPILEV